MSTITHSVRDIPSADRATIERIVGQPLHDQDQLIIQLVPGSTLPAWCNVFSGMSQEEIDAIDSAIVRMHTTRDVF